MTTPTDHDRRVAEEAAEKICHLSSYGQQLHVNDILPDILAAAEKIAEERTRMLKDYCDILEDQLDVAGLALAAKRFLAAHSKSAIDAARAKGGYAWENWADTAQPEVNATGTAARAKEESR